MKKKDVKSLKDILRSLLEKKNLSSNALAKQLNLPTPTIHRLVTGDVRDPHLSTLLLIADYFGMTLESLIGRDPKIIGKETIPVLPFNDFSYSKNIISHAKKYSPLSCLSKNAFSLLIENKLYEPLFFQNSLLVIEPERQPKNGDYVLVIFKDDATPVIKRYRVEGKNQYLYIVPGESVSEKISKDKLKIIGVVTDSWKKLITK